MTKLYSTTIRCDIRLPSYAHDIIVSEAVRTGIQKAVLLRSIILDWIEKEHGALPDMNLAGSDQAAQQHTTKQGGCK